MPNIDGVKALATTPAAGTSFADALPKAMTRTPFNASSSDPRHIGERSTPHCKAVDIDVRETLRDAKSAAPR